MRGGGAASFARQRRRQAQVRYGDHFLESESREVRVTFFLPYIRSTLRTSPRSPAEKTSSWPRANIENISADQGPRPQREVRIAKELSTVSRLSEMSRMSLFLTASAKFLMVFILALERPAPRKTCSGVRATDRGVSFPAQAFLTRANMLSAALVPSCWDMTMDMRAENKASEPFF